MDKFNVRKNEKVLQVRLHATLQIYYTALTMATAPSTMAVTEAETVSLSLPMYVPYPLHRSLIISCQVLLETNLHVYFTPTSIYPSPILEKVQVIFETYTLVVVNAVRNRGRRKMY